jgi:hypothetical protein
MCNDLELPETEETFEDFMRILMEEPPKSEKKKQED